MLRSERRSQERRQVPAIHVFVWSLTCRVMPARQHRDFVIEPMAREFRNRFARELGQERQIVRGIDNQRLLRPAGKLPEIRHRTDRHPRLPQLFQIDLLFDSLPYVACGLPVPNHIRKISRRVIERRHADARIVCRRNERITRAQACADNAEPVVALLLQPSGNSECPPRPAALRPSCAQCSPKPRSRRG